MNNHLKSVGMIRLVDLKIGDKFYGMDWDDENVYELIDLKIIHDNDSFVEYDVRILGTKTKSHHSITGEGVINRTTVVKYNGRDRGSFVAGFKAAMRIYQEHMQIFDKENAGLDNRFNTWNTMYQEYNNWKRG